MKILIVKELLPEKKIVHEYHNVPKKLANAVITLLDECANTETDICSAEREETYNTNVPIKCWEHFTGDCPYKN